LGQYRSAFRGSGLVFSDLREYQPGDDTKHIHWKATARTGTVYVKSFEEDRQLRVLLAVDTSASMRATFGYESFAKALEFCALIGSLTQRGNDLLGLFTFSDAPGAFLPPKAGPKRFSSVLSTLLQESQREASRTDLAAALDHLATVMPRSSIVFVLSDFECPEYHESLSKLSARHDVVLVQLQPPESAVTSAGLVTFRDAESGELCVVDTSSKRVQQAWSEAHKRRLDATRTIAERAGADHIVIHEDAARPLITLMKERVKRVSR
jgi:uncharacterized protein (DUF58 family)